MNDPILRPGNGQTFLGPAQRAEAWDRLGDVMVEVLGSLAG